MKQKIKKQLIIGFVFLTLPVFCCFGESVQDYFNRELIGDFEVLDSVKGKVEIQMIEIPDGKGGTSQCLEVTADEEAFTGKVGVSIPLPSIPAWWQFAHWWEIEVEAVWTPTRAMSDFVLECIDQNGESIEMMRLIERPSPNILGTPYPDIPDITGEMIPEKYHFPLIAVPKLRTADPSRVSKRANVVLWFTDWFGTARVGSLKIRPFKYTKEMQEQWKPEAGEFVCGGLPWFEPAYLSSQTAISTVESKIHKTLRDTGHKLLAGVGMNSMRYFTIWEEVEPVKGEYHFEEIDQLIEELEYYGIEIGVMTVHGVPNWAVSKTLEEVPDALSARKATWKIAFPPDNWDDYEKYVRAIVSHLKGKVKKWEVWNEPNSHVWGVLSPYKKYEQFLIRFYTEAKKVDPDCYVICGRVGWWINNMLREGMGNYMDAVALHPYPGSHGGNLDKVMRQFREVQLSLMAAGKKIPIEVTEFGLGASFPWTGPGAQNGEKAKAELLYEVLTAMKDVTPSIYWYTPIQGNRQYGIVQFESDRYRPVDSYWAFGKVSGALKEKNAIKAEVLIPDEHAVKGQETRITLRATNTSSQPQKINFWPIGFVDSIGFETLKEVRDHDWTGTLNPGQTHETTLVATPARQAYGRYPIGLVAINENGNCVEIQDLWIKSIASSSIATASSCDMGSIEAVNDSLIPVWSGDEDVPAMIWAPKPQVRKEWVQLDFEKAQKIGEIEVFWFADPKPVYALRGRQSVYSDKINELDDKYKMDAHGMEVENPGADIKIKIEGYDNFSVPLEWQLSYRSKNGQWKPVQNSEPFATEANRFNQVHFEPVTADAIRITARLRANKGGGVHEIRIH